MLDIIRNNDGSITIREVKETAAYTLADYMKQYEGVTEYNGIVAECQKWYYGSLVKAAWCATWLSFCLDKMGILEKTMGTKHENVYHAYTGLAKRCKNVGNQIKRGDIVVLCFSDSFTWNSSKHITVASEDYNGSGLIRCIGGNQDNAVSQKQYSLEDVVGVFRPAYA